MNGYDAKKESLSQSLKDTLLDYRLHLQMQLGKSKNTVLSYLSDVQQFAEFLFSRDIKDFSRAGTQDISSWICILSKGVKASTQSRKLSAIKSLATFLIEEKIWRSDFSELVARPKVRRPIPEVLSIDEMQKFLEMPSQKTFESLRDKAMLELMYCSGLRVSELCSIKSSDMDLDSKIIRVCGKGDKVRLVPIGARAINFIMEYAQIRQEKFVKKNPIYFFTTNRSKAISRKTFWYNVRKYALLCGIQKSIKPHMLRHCFATHLLGAGANLMAIKEMLGHADLSTTQIYTKVLPQTLASAHAAAHPRARSLKS